MAAGKLENRVAVLEEELAQLKAMVQAKPTSTWYESIVGVFAEDESYRKAMRLGRAYRESLRPKKRSRKPRA